jgi:hypothetical protein
VPLRFLQAVIEARLALKKVLQQQQLQLQQQQSARSLMSNSSVPSRRLLQLAAERRASPGAAASGKNRAVESVRRKMLGRPAVETPQTMLCDALRTISPEIMHLLCPAADAQEVLRSIMLEELGVLTLPGSGKSS